MTDLPYPKRAAAMFSVHVAHNIRLAFLEARPVVQLVFLLRFIVGGSLSGSIGFPDLGAIVGCLSWAAAVWFVYLLNGVSDIAGDRQNSSLRPLASGALDPHFAVNLCLILAAGSLLVATLVGYRHVLLVASMLILGMVYSLGSGAAKKSGALGLGVAAAGALLTYLAGAESSGVRVTPAAWWFALTAAAWIATAGHTKDFGDEAGDIKTGRRTLPIVLGVRRARLLIAAGTLLVGLAAALIALYVPGVPTLSLLLPGALAVAYQLGRGKGTTRLVDKRPYRTFMLVQYAVNLSTFIW